MVYRAAVIGCGKIGTLFADDPLVKGIYTHVGAYTASPYTDLVAVCDLDLQKAMACAHKLNISAYDYFEKMLIIEKPEIVSICTPDHTHGEILAKVLQNNSVRAVLVEKPIALTKVQAQQLIQLAKQTQILLVVNYSRRFSTEYSRIKKYIQTGGIGPIQSVSGFYTKGILHNGTHWLDLIRWMIGEIKIVQGFNSNKINTYDPTLNAWMLVENDIEVFLHGLDEKAFTLFEMDIIGTSGRIRFKDSGHTIEFSTVKDSPYYSGFKSIQKSCETDGALQNVLLNVVNHLVLCLEQKLEPLCSGEDGLQAISIANALIESAKKGCRIHL